MAEHRDKRARIFATEENTRTTTVTLSELEHPDVEEDAEIHEVVAQVASANALDPCGEELLLASPVYWALRVEAHDVLQHDWHASGVCGEGFQSLAVLPHILKMIAIYAGLSLVSLSASQPLPVPLPLSLHSRLAFHLSVSLYPILVLFLG